MNIYEKLLDIQQELKAPKNQYNSFGKYHYRSCEDILEGVKPLLDKNKAILTLTDELMQVGERYYIKATAQLIDVEKGESIESTAFARESETKKGMDLSQITGSASSYARKYALNGLFCIDDTKDADFHQGRQEQVSSEKQNRTHENRQTKQVTNTATKSQIGAIYAIMKKNKISDDEKIKGKVSSIVNRRISSMKELTKQEASKVIAMLNALA